METQRTLILLKPDCVRRGLMGEVISRIERKGYAITSIRSCLLSESILRKHYAHIADKPFFPRILTYMMSGTVVALVVEGDNVVHEMRKLMGATMFTDAIPGTIRGDLANNSFENIIHGSDTPESAEIEIDRFFSNGHIEII